MALQKCSYFKINITHFYSDARITGVGSTFHCSLALLVCTTAPYFSSLTFVSGANSMFRNHSITNVQIRLFWSRNAIGFRHSRSSCNFELQQLQLSSLTNNQVNNLHDAVYLPGYYNPCSRCFKITNSGSEVRGNALVLKDAQFSMSRM